LSHNNQKDKIMYGIFLIAELGRVKNVFDKNAPYDLLWETSERIYQEFQDSEFNNLNKSEYDAISDYLDTFDKINLEN